MTAHDAGTRAALDRASQPPTDTELAEHLARMSDAAREPVWFDPAHYARLAETPAPLADLRDGLDNDSPLPVIPVLLVAVALFIGAAGLWLAGVW